MSLLFETIRIIDGSVQNISLHEARMNQSRRIIFGRTDPVHLTDHIIVPAASAHGLVRCRIIYGPDVRSAEYFPYKPAVVRTLRKIEDNTVIYDHKYLDRERLNALIDKTMADDILIIRDGCVTDCSYANIVFLDGSQWVTPDTPLLRGTMREKLLIEGVITERKITQNDLQSFSHFRLVNAMLGFGFPVQPVANIQ